MPALLKDCPDAIERLEPHDPITADTPYSFISRSASLLDFSLSDSLSAITSCTFLPSTSGNISLASFMPSSSSLPPSSAAPLRGSSTPIFITSGSDCSSSSCEIEQPPSTSTAERSRAVSFMYVFIIYPRYSFLLDMVFQLV